MPRKHTDEDVARWYARYQQGLTLNEVAREFRVGTPTVLGEFVRRGLPRRSPGLPPAEPRAAPAVIPRIAAVALPARQPPGLPDREWRVLLARREGRTLADIGGDLGVSRQRVSQIEARALGRLARQAPAEEP